MSERNETVVPTNTKNPAKVDAVAVDVGSIAALATEKGEKPKYISLKNNETGFLVSMPADEFAKYAKAERSEWTKL